MTRSLHHCGKRSLQTAAYIAAAAFAVTILLAVLWAGPGAAAAAGGGAHRGSVSQAVGVRAEPHRSWVKYYIVPPPRDGQKAYLYEIAAQTLGDGNLYREIFNLNKGRLQPDGARLEDPATILPGWILVLPASARGPGVHFGPLPRSSGAGQGGAGGAVPQWILRALMGCLVLLSMVMVGVAARAWLRAGRQPGRHRYGSVEPCAAAGTGPAVSWRERREADVYTAPPCDPGTAQPAHLAWTASAAVMSPPPAASPEAAHLQPCDLVALQQEPYSPPHAAAVAADPLPVPDGHGWAPRVVAVTPDPDLSWGDGTDKPALSPAALRRLGVRAGPAGKAAAAGAAVVRHEVVLGDYRVQVLLAEAPASSREGRSPEVQTWVASAPYLVWAPLPHDVPGGGLAFACIGTGDEGCLFIDLAAAPGAVTFGGERNAATGLAVSIANQLCSGSAADRILLIVVGDAVPAPHPLGTEWVASLADLRCRGQLSPDDKAELVFCQLNSDEDVFPLARYVASAQHRVVPLVLAADLPGAPWSFTAYPSHRPAGALQPEVSRR